MGKVVHVSDELHAELIKICKKEGAGLKELGERVLLKFIKEKQTIPPTPVSQKKKLETTDAERGNGPSPWELPPFWEGGKRIEQDRQENQLEKDGAAAREGAGGGEVQLPQVVEDARRSATEQAFPSGERSEEAA